MLHDIGKIGVPGGILRKTGRLTDEEFTVVRDHPSIGAKILGGIRQLDGVIEGILSHHERLDGKGYPRGLKGKDVPIEGLIVGLADAFDAMTSTRTYRKSMCMDRVLENIRKCSGTQFDPELVEILIGLDPQQFVEECREPVETVFPVEATREQTK